MTDSEDKELQAPDVAGASIQPSNPEDAPRPVNDKADDEELEIVYEKVVDDAEDEASTSAAAGKLPSAADLEDLTRTKSHATDASVASHVEDLNEQYRQRPWYRKLNPLRWGGIAPIPEERTVSREYKASFLSKMTFQWMAPLMTVSFSIIS
jgi:ATP-binding cassette subfamily C (CFTR/MRP) protein 1